MCLPQAQPSAAPRLRPAVWAAIPLPRPAALLLAPPVPRGWARWTEGKPFPGQAVGKFVPLCHPRPGTEQTWRAGWRVTAEPVSRPHPSCGAFGCRRTVHGWQTRPRKPAASLMDASAVCQGRPCCPRLRRLRQGAGDKWRAFPEVLCHPKETLSHAGQWLLKTLPCKYPAAGLGRVYPLFLENWMTVPEFLRKWDDLQ